MFAIDTEKIVAGITPNNGALNNKHSATTKNDLLAGAAFLGIPHGRSPT
jgi:hypothetical protein